jgi:hypothetical protein
MRLDRIGLVILSIFAVAAPAAAQVAPPRVEVSLFPSSKLMTTKGASPDQPSFHAYTPGGALRFNLNRYFGIEADLSGGRGNAFSPAMTAIAVDAIVSLAPSARVRPYAEVGAGSIHMFKNEDVGMMHGETFDSANFGGGVAVLFTNWGIRADYRFLGMDSTAVDRSTFVGPGTRHAHRISAGIIIGPGSRPLK